MTWAMGVLWSVVVWFGASAVLAFVVFVLSRGRR